MSRCSHSVVSSSTQDLVIVGGGLVGAALALALAQGLKAQPSRRILLLEQAPAALDVAPALGASVDDFASRVSAISPANAHWLTALGAWPAAAACAYQQMQVWDADGTGAIHFDADSLHVEQLGFIVENHRLLQALRQALPTCAVAQRYQCELRACDWTGNGWQLTLSSGERFSPGLLIAADGARSQLRRWVGLPTREWDYGQQALVCTLQTQRPHQDTAWQRFSTHGPLAFLPLRDAGDSQRFSSLVWSQDVTEARRLMALDDAAFAAALGEASEHCLGEILAVSERQCFPLRQSHAKRYIKPGFALVGDAAHSIHPLAGMGVNLGFADARALSEEICRASQRQSDLGAGALLSRYERRRMGENLAVAAAMEGFKQLFSQDQLPLRWLRNAGMRWVDSQPLLKQQIAARAMGL